MLTIDLMHGTLDDWDLFWVFDLGPNDLGPSGRYLSVLCDM